MWGYNKKVQYYLNNELQNGVILGVNALGQLMMEENNQTVLYNFKEIRFVI